MQETFKKQLLKSPLKKQWKKIGVKPHHGIILMLSSLHSQTSLGCGEFLDLIPIIEWCASIGFDFVQLLPLNDTGFDNSPYNPISTLALNPIYLSLQKLPYLKDDSELQQIFIKEENLINEPFFDYHATRQLKLSFLQKYYLKYFRKIESSFAYSRFIRKNSWVYNYALFCTFCEKYNTDRWDEWPQECQKLSNHAKNKLLKQNETSVLFFCMVQYLCFLQLKEVKSVAEKNKIFLMGDLPFLVSKYSCDVWDHQNLFFFNCTVGSPPDDFTPNGQNWGFPAFNIETLKKTDYHWWKVRLKVAENFFHIYRLDHVIGFFRTWNIPIGLDGIDGDYAPKDPNLWLELGKTFLSVLINNSKMLPIGEDLVVAQTIKDVLRELGICGTHILIWQRTGAGGADFVPYPLYPVASITSVASHDTPTLSQWWHNYPKIIKLFCLWNKWEYTPEIDIKKRFQILRDCHHTSSLFHANLLQEYLALFPKMVHQDYNMERINYPGTPPYNNWRYRFIPSVEEITTSKELHETLTSIIS